MRIRLPGLIALASLLAINMAEAQPATEGVVSARPSVNLTAEQHHIIKEIVLKDMKVPPATAEVRLSIGEPVSGVALQSFPPSITEKVPEVKSHNFFVKNDQVGFMAKCRND